MPKTKVLIIEDEPMFVKLWESNLGDLIDQGKLVIARCVNVEQAVEAIRHHCPEVLFLDHHLSRFDLDEGFKIVQAVGPEFPDMRIISTSAHFGLPGNDAFKSQYEILGVTEWVSKRMLAEQVRAVSA